MPSPGAAGLIGGAACSMLYALWAWRWGGLEGAHKTGKGSLFYEFQGHIDFRIQKIRPAVGFSLYLVEQVTSLALTLARM